TNIASNPDLALIFARTTLIGPVLLSFGFLLFSKFFVGDKKFNSKRAIGYAIAPLLIIITFPTELNIKSIEAYGRNTVAGPIYLALVPMILVYFAIGLATLIKKYRSTRSNTEKNQLRYIFLG